MTLSPEILATDVDALSPIDETLMGAIRSNLMSLDGQVNGSGSPLSPIVQFKLNGPLDALQGGRLKRADIALITNAQTLSQVYLYLDQPGTSGTLEVDLRTITTPKVPITSILPQFEAATQSIARAGGALSTQSITRTTAQISTQSITQFKPALNILSIVSLGANLWQYNLSAAPDSDWVVGDTVTFSGATAAANNGSFLVVRVNDFGSASVVVSNSSGVAQASAAGSATLRAYAYNFTNPASSEFAAGEAALFSAHTTAGNNGTLTIHAVNSGGNNIVVKNPNGATQSGAAGNVNVQRFSYNLASAAVLADFIVGDTIYATGHTSTANNTAALAGFRITAVNSGGNNVQVYSSAGVTQGAAAGSIQSNQWVFALPTDPTGQVSVGDEVFLSGHTSAANNGQLAVRQVKRAGANNVTVHNSLGVAQAGVAGLVTHTRKLVKFASDQAAVFSTASLIEVEGSGSSFYNTFNQYDVGFRVLEVNRGGGANYNVVIKVDGAAPSQSGQAGWVSIESRSIFSTTPKITTTVSGARTLGQASAQTQTTAAVFSSQSLAAGARLAMYVLSVPAGGYGVGVQIR